jgi:alkylated DNA repair dioxygenase AlkB
MESHEPTALPFNSNYIEDVFHTDNVAKKVATETMHHYLYRGQRMVRAPKNEFYYKHENRNVTYKWGQQTSMYPTGAEYTGKEMPRWMRKITKKLRSNYGQPVNHAIIIKYDHGLRTHAPPHQDKVPPETSFFVFSFGNPRRFDVLASQIVESVDNKKRDSDGNPVKRYNHDGTVKTKVAPANVVWSKELAHNSLLVVDGPTNQNYYHAIPKDSAWKGERWSLIFRTIA